MAISCTLVALVVLQYVPCALMYRHSKLPEQIHMAFGKPASRSITISWCTKTASRLFLSLLLLLAIFWKWCLIDDTTAQRCRYGLHPNQNSKADNSMVIKRNIRFSHLSAVSRWKRRAHEIYEIYEIPTYIVADTQLWQGSQGPYFRHDKIHKPVYSPCQHYGYVQTGDESVGLFDLQ